MEMVTLIAMASAALYLTAGLLTARVTYGRIRPSTVPLCGYAAGARHLVGGTWQNPGSDCHYTTCFKRFGATTARGGIDGTADAVLAAVAAGVWTPLFLLGYGACRVITARPPQTKAEQDARISKLEAENEKFRKELAR